MARQAGTRDGAGTADAARAGFTLVEVLVVLLIMAILISATFSGLGVARQMAWRTRARDTARQLVQAWNLYLNDYREFPEARKFANARPEGGYETSPANIELLNAERVYIEMSEADRDAGLRDKWGRRLGFNLDFDYDGIVANPAPEVFEKARAVQDSEQVKATAIAWSQGHNPALKKKWVVQW
jgi:prepilin-type N-terminal cleavage/methylation domain-containing protein